MRLIMSKGHSRIPIHSGSPQNIIGLVLVKNLIFCHPEDETPIKSMTIRRIPRVDDNWPLYDILNQFQKGHTHMVVVKRSVGVSSRDAEQNMDTKSYLKAKQTGRKGIHSPFGKKDHICYSTDASSSLYSTDNEIESPALESIMEHGHALAVEEVEARRRVYFM